MKTATIGSREVCLFEFMEEKIKELCNSEVLFEKLKAEFVDINDLRCAKEWELIDLGFGPIMSKMIIKYTNDVWDNFHKPVFFRPKVEKHTLGAIHELET